MTNVIGIRNTNDQKFDLVKGVMANIKASLILHGENPTHLDTIYKMAKYYAENNGMIFITPDGKEKEIPYYKTRDGFNKLKERIEKHLRLGYPFEIEAMNEISTIIKREEQHINFNTNPKERHKQIYDYLSEIEKQIIE